MDLEGNLFQQCEFRPLLCFCMNSYLLHRQNKDRGISSATTKTCSTFGVKRGKTWNSTCFTDSKYALASKWSMEADIYGMLSHININITSWYLHAVSLQETTACFLICIDKNKKTAGRVNTFNNFLSIYGHAAVDKTSSEDRLHAQKFGLKTLKYFSG